MELKDLTLKERLLLSSRVQHDAARFFHTLATNLKPADPKSSQLLENLALDETTFEERVERLDREVPWSTVLHLDERAVRSILHRYLPELYRWVAVRGASPENALKLARDIEREIADFHELLARGLSDGPSQEMLESFCKEERSHVASLVNRLATTGH